MESIFPFKGERNPSARLTEDNVREIRTLLESGVKVRIIASKFRVSITLIYSIKSKKLWKDV